VVKLIGDFEADELKVKGTIDGQCSQPERYFEHFCAVGSIMIAFAFALGFPPCTFERLSFLHVICFQGRLHTATVLFNAPTLLFPRIDWGFLIFWGLWLGDSVSGFYGEAFHASLSSSLFFSSFWILGKKLWILFRAGSVQEKMALPMGTYEEMGKGRINTGR